ncbi:histidine kinase [Spirosoma taeanense]|uniref:Histidine kinase n=1 Tax=Spirosoma taeanense TaxID=2735870 RepID=A0A6M5Y9X6_9BACT|nr:sensor histidine kinase [Spirosoma taeanense]QJW90176.1 histidine kinase [Spirosoma taeanense]
MDTSLKSLVSWRWLAICLLISGLAGIPLRLWGQSARPAEAGNSTVQFERLTTEQGLSNYVVVPIMQDRKGYLWFGTATGLDKYDGYRFTNYKFDPRDTTSLTKNQVYTLLEDRDGLIWVGTSEGTCRFNPRTEKFIRLVKSPANPHAFSFIQSIGEDKEGNLWVGGGFTGELRQVDRKTGQFSATNYANLLGGDPSGNQALYLTLRDKSGTFWVGSPTGLHRLNLAPAGAGKPSRVSFTHYRHNPDNPNSLSQNFVTGLYEDRQGLLWVVTSEGVLHSFDRWSGQFIRYPLDPVRKLGLLRRFRTGLVEDQEGNLWVGTYRNGLYKMNKDRNLITNYIHNPTDPNSIVNNTVFTLMVDKSGIMWAATLGGVIKLDPNRKPFRLYRHNPVITHSLSQNNIAAICEDHQNALWLGTMESGLNVLNRATGQFRQYRHQPGKITSLRSDVVTALLKTRDGSLWVGNGGYLSRFNRNDTSFTHYPLHHPFLMNSSNSLIFTIYEDRQGTLWLGTDNGFLSFDQRTGKTVSYPYDPEHPERVSDYWALAILEDRRGNLWIGPGSQALTRFDRRTGTFKQYRYDGRKPGSISSTTIPSIYEDSKGSLWFGTGEGGLCRFDHATETFTTFTEQDGLAGNSVYSILEDDGGNLWLGTNKGLSKFSLTTHQFTNYSADEGLQGNIFAAWFIEGAACKGKDGTLYFGGNNGFNAFDPTTIQPNSHVPPIVITQFRLFDKIQPGMHEASEIILNHDQNFFSFEFAALNYTNSPKNQYAYQLVGLEKDWVYSGTRRIAAFTDLDPGTYTFRVKGSNNDGVWNEKGTSLVVVIQPAWWQTVWFKIIIGLAFAGLLYAAYRYRINQLRHEQAIRDQISRDLHDDVGGILSGISFYSEAARQMHQQGRHADSYQLLLKIADNARQTISQMSDVVWSMRSDTNNAGQLAQRLELVGRELLTARGIHLKVETDTGLERLTLRPDVVRNLYLIGKEALHNAGKYSQATEVVLAVRYRGNRVQISITDNGQGFDLDLASSGGNGLDNMPRRAKAMGAVYQLRSEPAKGTSVTVEKTV